MCPLFLRLHGFKSIYNKTRAEGPYLYRNRPGGERQALPHPGGIFAFLVCKLNGENSVVAIAIEAVKGIGHGRGHSVDGALDTYLRDRQLSTRNSVGNGAIRSGFCFRNSPREGRGWRDYSAYRQ